MAAPAARWDDAVTSRRTLMVARSAVDASRLFGFLLVVVAGLVAGTVASGTVSGVAEDLARAVGRAPVGIVSLASIVSQAAFLLVSLAVPIGLVATRRARAAWLGGLAAVAAVALFSLLTAVLPAGLAVLEDDGVLALPGGPPLPAGQAVAAYTAGATVIGTELTRRWSRALWTLLALVALTQVVTASATPLGIALALGLGGTIGSAALLALGRRVEAVTPYQVATTLGRTGMIVFDVHRLDDPAWPDWTLAVNTDLGPVAAKTVGVLEQRQDTLYRRYRRLRLKDVGEDEPHSSPRRAVAVEAMMSLLAERSGVRCPALRAVEPVSSEEFVLAVDYVPGRRMDGLHEAELTASVLEDAWRQVAALHRAGIAHRDLRLEQFLVDADGQVWLRDFAFGEPAASTTSLEGDVAELLAGTYTRVGAATAVAAAARVLEHDVISGALARLVPAALTRPTRAAVRATPGRLRPLVDEVCRVTGVSEPVFAQVERVRPRTLVVGLTVAVAFYIMLPQLADVPAMLEAVRGVSWVWLPGVVIASVLTYIGAALGLAGGTPGRVSVWQAFLVAMSSKFVVLVAPGAIGQVGLNVRFLQRRGYSTSVAVSASAAKETAVLVVHILLLVIFALWVGSADSLTGEWEKLPAGGTVLAVLGAVLGVSGVAVASPAARRWLRTSVRPAVRDALGAMAEVAASPAKMGTLFLGAALLPLGYATCLYFSVQALGGGASFPAVALVFLSVGALAAAAPTPGGLGAVEAVLLAALTGVGIPPAQALAAVFLYRLTTFWAPIAPGLASFRWLTAREVL